MNHSRANSFGGQVVSNKGQTYLVLPFNLEDFVLSGLSRQATPIYPKEAAAILQILDLQEGKVSMAYKKKTLLIIQFIPNRRGETASVGDRNWEWRVFSVSFESCWAHRFSCDL